MNNPVVSIGLPVYNGGKYIKEAIDSILAQSFHDFELIISDNASTDATTEICGSFANADHRIRYCRNEKNMGGAWNFNRVFQLAKGRYFQWACHDDVWTPTLLERCVEVLDRMPDVALCYSRTTFIDERGEPTRCLIRRPDLHVKDSCRRFQLFLRYHPNECNPVLGLFRANILEKTTLMGSYPASDMILLGEVALHGEFYEIPECLFLRRDHPQTSVRANPKWEDRAVWFDPDLKGRIQLPTWRWVAEWNRAVLRSPISLIDKMKCVSEVGKWGRRHWGNLKVEMKYCAKRLVSRYA
jgi:glycosyltransferase involved in cell wall biosynthesis